MERKRFTTEQIIPKLHEAEVSLATVFPNGLHHHLALWAWSKLLTWT